MNLGIDNQVADALVCHARTMTRHFCSLDSLSPFLCTILAFDTAGTVFPRRIPVLKINSLVVLLYLHRSI